MRSQSHLSAADVAAAVLALLAGVTATAITKLSHVCAFVLDSFVFDTFRRYLVSGDVQRRRCEIRLFLKNRLD